MAGSAAEADMTQEQCSRCGAVVAGGTEGCRRLFHQLLAQEYSDPAYGAVNLLAVDAHALQHPEDHGVKNNGFHLARLCWLLEHGGSAALGAGPRWLQASFDGHMEPPVLDPPRDRGSVTVADVHGASSPEDHAARVRRWAASVWEAWSAHHAWARRWVEDHA
jgi:hypothetical protein